MTTPDVNVLAFGQEDEAQLVAIILASDRYIPQLAWVWSKPVDKNIDPHKSPSPRISPNPPFERGGLGGIPCATIFDHTQLALVAETDNIIVGHILFSYINLVGEETCQVLSLAPVSVLPKYQKQGIGSQLVKASLEVAEKMSEALVIVLGHPEFYPLFGFQPAKPHGIEPPFPVPEAAWMFKALNKYLPKYRGKVVFSPAFNSVL